MRLLFFFLLVGIVASAPAAKNESRKPFVMHGKQQRWTAAGLKAYHEKMRKVHKVNGPVQTIKDCFTVRTTFPTIQTCPLSPTFRSDRPVSSFHYSVLFFFSLFLLLSAVDYRVSLESGSEAIFLLAQDYPGRDVAFNQPFYNPEHSSTSKYVGDYHAFSGDLQVYGTTYSDLVGVSKGFPCVLHSKIFAVIICLQILLFRMLFVMGRYFILVVRQRLAAQHNAMVWYVNSWTLPSTSFVLGAVNSVYDEQAVNPELPNGVLGLSW
jgi:hypothetical protein